MSTKTFDPVAYKAAQRRDWTGAAAGWRKWWKAFEEAFGPVGDRLIELAGAGPGQRVLDVATGVGEPAITAARVVGRSGTVVGTDISPGMLEVARERAREAGLDNVEFYEMDAEALDLPDGSFDAVLCRFGLMFLPDIDGALRDVRRLLAPGGRFAASVWGPPDRVPMNSVILGAVARTLQLPPPPSGTPGLFALADAAALTERLLAGGFTDVKTETLEVRLEVDGLDDYMQFLEDVAAPIHNLLANETSERRAQVWAAVAEAAREHFVRADGRVHLSGESLLVAARR